MDDKFDRILEHRENKYQKINFLKKNFKTVITVKSNIPGLNKNEKEAYILIDLFKNLIPSDYIVDLQFDDGPDGPSYIIVSNSDPAMVKQSLIVIEDSHFLGRFIDLDVFGDYKSLNRNKMRKCFVCNDVAFKCIKEARHRPEELKMFIFDKVYKFYENRVKVIINDSILLELDLHPKFGLVTPYTNGSHMDMSYDIMLSAKDSILPFFLEMFKTGWTKDITNIFTTIRQIGLQAEEAMFITTSNINAYKGLIFDLGILVSAYAYVVKNNIDIDGIFGVVKKISIDVLDDFKFESDTFGYKAYKNYGFLGARGEAYNGFPNVQNALKYLIDFSTSSRRTALMFLISEVEDTVLLKRCGSIEKYNKLRNTFKENINSNISVINEIDQNCIEENLSFGGSADLLILSIFLKKIGV